MAGAAPGRGAGHARHLRGPARPQIHVVQGLRPMDDPVLVREVHDQAVRLQPVVALSDLDATQELQQPLFLGRLRPRGLDQGRRIVLVLDLELDVLEQLEAARLPVVGETERGPGEVLPLELDGLVALDGVVVAPIDQLVRLQVHAVLAGDVHVALEDGPLLGGSVDPFVRGDGRLAGLPPGHVGEVHLHAPQPLVLAVLALDELGAHDDALTHVAVLVRLHGAVDEAPEARALAHRRRRR